MSELQGPRIPGEERSGRRRSLGWIIGGLLALLLLALLVPFACQALGGGADSQGRGSSGAQGKAVAQEADDGRGDDGARDTDGAKSTGAGGYAQAEPAGDEGSQAGKDTAAEADGVAGSGAEDSAKSSNERGDARTSGELPETGGMSPTALLVVGTVLLLMGSTGLSAVVRRRSANEVRSAP
jgi:LPXTG-motif cell wall-anchored protein